MTSTALCPADVPTSAARLEIRYATGTVCVWGEPISLTAIEHALLFSIARHRHASTRDQLIDLVWGDEATEQTINVFNVALHRLRRRLGGADAIVHSAAGYALCSEAVVDIARLETLARTSRRLAALDEREFAALRHVYEAWRPSAPFVSDKYEWLEATSHRARTLLAEVGVAFGRCVLQRGNVSQALEVAYDLLDADGCDEQATELMISALLARGDRGEALRVYRRYSSVLLSELGLRPSPNVTTLLAAPSL